MILDDLGEYLRTHDDYLVVTHDGPDADGLGAAYALVLALLALGKRAVAAVTDRVPRKFAFIDRRGLFVSLASLSLSSFGDGRSTMIILDTHDLGYLGSRAEPFLAKAARKIVLDHHEISSEPGLDELIDPAASSSCELVFLLIAKLGVDLPLDAAEAIFAGMVYDTGSFSYPKTGERSFACALELVRKGVQPYSVHKMMYESLSGGVLSLQKAVLSTLEIFAEGRIAIQRLGREELAASGASYEDAEDLVNVPLQDKAVEVSVLFKENAEGKLRCSLRSKGGVDVARLAQGFGGGGHRTAAGFTCASPLESAKADVLKTIVERLGEDPARRMHEE